jgi:hypothetical protein
MQWNEKKDNMHTRLCSLKHGDSFRNERDIQPQKHCCPTWLHMLDEATFPKSNHSDFQNDLERRSTDQHAK